MLITLEEMIKYKLQKQPAKAKELLEMIKEDLEDGHQGMRIWFEDEFDEIEEQHKNELKEKDSELHEKDTLINDINGKLIEKESEINEKDKIIADLTEKLNKTKFSR